MAEGPFKRRYEGRASPVMEGYPVVRGLHGLADTEFVVDLLGVPDEAPSNLAKAGLRDIVVNTKQGELANRIRSLSGDLPRGEEMYGDAGLYLRGGPEKTIIEGGSRGDVKMRPGDLVLNPGEPAETIRHELSHHGINLIRNQPYGGEGGTLSQLILLNGSKPVEELVSETLDAVSLKKSGKKRPDKYEAVGRNKLDVIAEYLVNRTPENRKKAAKLIQNTLIYGDRNRYDNLLIQESVFAIMRSGRGVQQGPEFLDSLEKAVDYFNAEPDAEYAVGGIAAIPVDDKMINPEILSQIERIMGR